MRRQEALMALLYASLAGLVFAPLVVLGFEVAFDEVALAETFGGALFAVLFFASTSITVALNQNSPRLAQAALTSYILKSVVVLAALMWVPIGDINRNVAAASIAVSAFSFLIVQTVYIARRKGRTQRRISRVS